MKELHRHEAAQVRGVEGGYVTTALHELQNAGRFVLRLTALRERRVS